MLDKFLKHVVKKTNNQPQTSAAYWTSHNVTLQHKFQNREDSLNYFDWRCRNYIGYRELMNVEGFDKKIIMDYGCGPGHDVVGFLEFSKPEKVYGIDVSRTSLSEAKSRVSH